MIRATFERELQDLQDRLLALGSEVGENIVKAVGVLIQRDRTGARQLRVPRHCNRIQVGGRESEGAGELDPGPHREPAPGVFQSARSHLAGENPDREEPRKAGSRLTFRRLPVILLALGGETKRDLRHC